MIVALVPLTKLYSRILKKKKLITAQLETLSLDIVVNRDKTEKMKVKKKKLGFMGE